MEVIPRNTHSNDGGNGNTSSQNHDNETNGRNIEKNNNRFHFRRTPHPVIVV